MQTRWLLLGALLFACQSTKPIGENDPDASLITGDGGGDDGGGGDAGGDAATACACDASSCGSRICGRSACGFPCGECAPGDSCLLGAACTGGGDTPCVDAFGDRVGTLDLGFRACPTDATKQQRCMCNGGGADDWASCDPGCVEICTQVASGIACGTPACGGSEICCISIISTNARACSAGACGALNYTRACDGPEDCAAGSSCCGGSDDMWTATCTPVAACGAVEQFCHTRDDCPTTKPYCCPGQVEDMRSCSTTAAPTCT